MRGQFAIGNPPNGAHYGRPPPYRKVPLCKGGCQREALTGGLLPCVKSGNNPSEPPFGGPPPLAQGRLSKRKYLNIPSFP